MSKSLFQKLVHSPKHARKLYAQLLNVSIPVTIRVVACLNLLGVVINCVFVGGLTVQIAATIRDIINILSSTDITGFVSFLGALLGAVVNIVNLLSILFSLLQIALLLLLSALLLKTSTALLSFKWFGPRLTYTSQGLLLIYGHIFRVINAPHLADSPNLWLNIRQVIWAYHGLIGPILTIGVLVATLIKQPDIRQRFHQSSHQRSSQ